MKVLFIGGTGTISSAVSELAVARGVDLVLLNRGTRAELLPPAATHVKGDVRDVETVSKLVARHRFDVVVDWVAFTPEHVAADVQLFAGKVGQYVFISSASVYQKPPERYVVTEATPLDNPFAPYSQNKIACERRLMSEHADRGFPVTIVRPSYTYNRSRIPHILNSKRHEYSLVDRMRAGKRVIVPGDGTSLWTLTHAADFAKGILGLFGNPKAVGNAFHITSDEVLDWDRITRLIGRAAGVEPRIAHVSSEFVCAFAPHLVGSLVGDKSVSLVLDNRKIKAFVPEFVATIPFAEGIEQSMRWFDADASRRVVDEEYNALVDRILFAHDAGMAMAKA
jgi:nucleoside-diphosphate-sugar epimerase